MQPSNPKESEANQPPTQRTRATRKLEQRWRMQMAREKKLKMQTDSSSSSFEATAASSILHKRQQRHCCAAAKQANMWRTCSQDVDHVTHCDEEEGASYCESAYESTTVSIAPSINKAALDEMLQLEQVASCEVIKDEIQQTRNTSECNISFKPITHVSQHSKLPNSTSEIAETTKNQDFKGRAKSALQQTKGLEMVTSKKSLQAAHARQKTNTSQSTMLQKQHEGLQAQNAPKFNIHTKSSKHSKQKLQIIKIYKDALDEYQRMLKLRYNRLRLEAWESLDDKVARMAAIRAYNHKHRHEILSSNSIKARAAHLVCARRFNKGRKQAACKGTIELNIRLWTNDSLGFPVEIKSVKHSLPLA